MPSSDEGSPIHPDDRLWRHPSEVRRVPPPTVLCGDSGSRSRGLHRSLGVGLGLGLGLVAAVGVLALWWTVRADDPQPSTLAVGVAAAAMPSGIQHATAAVSTSTSSPSTTVRPRLALQGVDVEPGDGVLVMMVAASGSADRAGVQPGDVILAVDDQDVTTMDELITVLGRHPFGDTVTVTLERADRVLRVPVTLDDM